MSTPNICFHVQIRQISVLLCWKNCFVWNQWKIDELYDGWLPLLETEIKMMSVTDFDEEACCYCQVAIHQM